MATKIMLHNVPEDIYCILTEEQEKLKKQKGVKIYGIEQTLYTILREFKRCEKMKKNA